LLDLSLARRRIRLANTLIVDISSFIT